MKRPPRILLYGGALLLVVLVVALLGSGARNGGSLQSYRAELRARGEKLTFQELELSRSKNRNNSMAALSNAVASLGMPQFPPGDIEVRKYVRPGYARLAWRGASPGCMSTTSSDAQPTWTDLAEQITAAQPALAELREALRDPRASSGPCTNLMTGPPSNFVAVRKAAQWLMNDALYESRQGHVEQALQDLEAMASLAQFDREECTLVAQAIRVAVTGLGLGTSWEVLQVPGWTDPQLERLQKAWETIHPVEAIEFAFVGWRAYAGELSNTARKSGLRQASQFTGVAMPASGSLQGFLTDYAWLPIYRLTCMNADTLFHLKLAEETLTGLRLLEAHRPWKEAKQHIDQPWAWIRQVDRFPTKLRYWVSLTSFPNPQRITTTAVRAETERQMTLAAIALKRYQLRHGTLPPDLAALVPELLPVAPYDPINGKALCYRLKPDGTFVLYSVGEDGKDDGGDPTPTSGNKPGLWEGRDAVWPAPETDSKSGRGPARRSRRTWCAGPHPCQVAQVSQPAVSPTFQSAARPKFRRLREVPGCGPGRERWPAPKPRPPWCPALCQPGSQAVYKGCTRDAQGVHTGGTRACPVSIRCASLVHPLYTARGAEELPGT